MPACWTGSVAVICSIRSSVVTPSASPSKFSSTRWRREGDGLDVVDGDAGAVVEEGVALGGEDECLRTAR